MARIISSVDADVGDGLDGFINHIYFIPMWFFGSYTLLLTR